MINNIKVVFFSLSFGIFGGVCMFLIFMFLIIDSEFMVVFFWEVKLFWELFVFDSWIRMFLELDIYCFWNFYCLYIVILIKEYNIDIIVKIVMVVMLWKVK